MSSKHAYVEHPEDWRGRTVEVYADGAVMLDSGLFSRERKQQGVAPIHTMVIEEKTTGTDILTWLHSVGAR